MEKHPDVVVLIFAGSALLVLLAFFIISFLFYYQRRQLRNIQEKQIMRTQFSETLLQTQLEIQEQTLKNISQEIHDNIGQVLSLAKLNINTMSGSTAEALEEKINDSKNLVSKAIQDLRDLSRSLNTDYVIELGLMRSVEYELELIKKTGTLQTNFSIEGKTYRLDQQQELILFRMVQEILHNIIKHAKAKTIDVSMNYQPDVFAFTIADDGEGFDTGILSTNNNDGAGLGIRNMHNRAQLIGANFNLTSTIGKGTAITITLPLSKP